jgi:hypothetical protein
VNLVVRLLVFVLGMLTANSPTRRQAVRYQFSDPYPGEAPGAHYADPDRPADGAPWPPPPAPLPPSQPLATGRGPAGPARKGGGPRPGRRRRIPLWAKWTAALLVLGLIFRRAIAAVVLIALSAVLHFVGINVHLPHVKFGWPWQTGTSANTDLGPWVLQKIEGISKPAFGQANFEFYFTHKVSKSMGPFPCWYASTFYAVGHASATVDLNPGPAWWKPASGHYRLQILSQPHGSLPGHVAVTMALPRPQLPQSVHDVTIDNVPSKPIDTQHSWTYPGLGCGVLIQPQFPQSVLYSQAQQIAFSRSQHDPQITGPLVSTAETQATQTIRNNFIQPTLNAVRYTLDRFAIRWVTAP